MRSSAADRVSELLASVPENLRSDPAVLRAAARCLELFDAAEEARKRIRGSTKADRSERKRAANRAREDAQAAESGFWGAIQEAKRASSRKGADAPAEIEAFRKATEDTETRPLVPSPLVPQPSDAAYQVARVLRDRLRQNGLEVTTARDAMGGWELEVADGDAEVSVTVFEGKHHLVVVAGPRGKNRLPGVGFVSKDIDAVVEDVRRRIVAGKGETT